MVKELICGHEKLSFWTCVLNDYNMITYSSDVASDMAN
jgi:hypothetical protein